MATPKRNQYDDVEYLRPKEAARNYGMGYDLVIEVAKECGAYRKLTKAVLINKKIMGNYIEAHNVF
ncbi:MAG: hypothetical protein IJ535_10795 [Pseudobutyrivibrio sp.]|uniref:DUF6462 family protein n=1 Tax=Pseudobutyrivibrio sp. TaxID=2014367 RepID=UPI0025DC389E|nr:DUF6462 family protein [Pseudobutyrivibrio sp.]MBQ8490255.1 hypothetical protein [Pseudobutyrivibrio sp.]